MGGAPDRGMLWGMLGSTVSKAMGPTTVLGIAAAC
jgi:hypothetical protein